MPLFKLPEVMLRFPLRRAKPTPRFPLRDAQAHVFNLPTVVTPRPPTHSFSHPRVHTVSIGRASLRSSFIGQLFSLVMCTSNKGDDTILVARSLIRT